MYFILCCFFPQKSDGSSELIQKQRSEWCHNYQGFIHHFHPVGSGQPFKFTDEAGPTGKLIVIYLYLYFLICQL